MEETAETLQALEGMLRELRRDLLEIYQYYHGEPPHLQKIFDRWIAEEQSSSYPFG